MTDVALLAPVPFVHLEDGAEVCREKGKVAFGSRAWEVFRELDEIRNRQPVPVFIYASLSDAGGPPLVTWTAHYIGHVESKGGAHPDGMEFRPKTTAKHETDNKGWWAVFWEVKDLTNFSEEKAVLIKELQSRKGKYYKSDFVPEGPTIIQSPWT